MKIFALLLLAAFASCSVIEREQPQLEVLHLLYKVFEPIRTRYVYLKRQSLKYDPKEHLEDYHDSGESALKLIKKIDEERVLEKKHWFSLFNEQHREEAVLFFDVLYNAKDWNTFISSAAYFRERLNGGVFVYGFYAGVTHSEQTKDIILPPLYEIAPHFYTNSEVIDEAYRAKMTQIPGVFRLNFTGTQRNPEQRVAYFGEDIGMNVHHVSWHLNYPFWWEKDVVQDRKGELFFWAHHQLTTRYDAERLSNDLDQVEPLAWDKPLYNGFAPHTKYRYGGEFPSRSDNTNFEDVYGIAKIRDLKNFESRIRDAIALGYVFNEQFETVDIRNEKGIEILGDLVESSKDSINQRYYGSLHNLGHIVVGRQQDPNGKYGFPPSVLEHFETSTRDPAFFRLHKYLNNIFKEHKDSLPPYTKEELEFTGVSLEKVEVPDELITYFEDFQFSLTNAVDDTEEIEDVDISAVVSRIQHTDFNFKFDINNNNNDDAIATIRVFLCPKKDVNGVELSFADARWNCVELDKFWTKLSSGANHIERSSTEASTTTPDLKSYSELEELAKKSPLELLELESPCGIPNRFLIPKGRPDGLKFDLFVAVTDGKSDTVVDKLYEKVFRKSHSHCGFPRGKNFPDKKPLGFPVDRKVDEPVFNELPNFHHSTVTIVHHLVHDHEPEHVHEHKHEH